MSAKRAADTKIRPRAADRELLARLALALDLPMAAVLREWADSWLKTPRGAPYLPEARSLRYRLDRAPETTHFGRRTDGGGEAP